MCVIYAQRSGIGPPPAFRRHTVQFLITDIRTLAQTWVSAASVREALIIHENAWRKRPLPPSTKASTYSQGEMIDASLGESACRGLRAHVVRR